MAKNKTKKLPEFKSLDDLVEFFDSQDLGDFWEDLPEAKFDVNIKSKKHLFTLDRDERSTYNLYPLSTISPISGRLKHSLNFAFFYPQMTTGKFYSPQFPFGDQPPYMLRRVAN